MTSDPGYSAKTTAELLRVRADLTPDAMAFGFLSDGEGPTLTYAELDRAARSVAAGLLAVADPGDRAMMLYAPGLAFVTAFFGCQYAGLVPVPAYPPRPDRLVQSWETLANIAADCSPRLILSDSILAPFVPTQLGPLAAATHLVTDQLPAATAEIQPTALDPDGTALLQYTSGSTANPKGVVIGHRNLLHNQRVILEAFEHDRHLGVGVCWLPPYHDMGLIGGLLQTVYRGAACWLMSPVTLLQDPFLWLRAISHYRADTSGGPNFAYDYCVQRITDEQKATLDLSNWSVAAIGSEPVRPETMRRFAEAFAGCGFRAEAFYPCYGLAEATLMVTGGSRTALPVVRDFDAAELDRGRAVPSHEAPSKSLVGCGRPWLGQDVRIVDPESRKPKADGDVGEIWVRGPSVARGYWNRPDEAEQTFRAVLAETGDGPYLRTGDWGFLDGGELFVTGRLKELIVIRGRNHHPRDIEATVQAVDPNLRPDCGAAFEIQSRGRTLVVVVQEVDRRCRTLDVARLTGVVRQAIAERHDIQLHELVLIESGSIPKTSSGKVRHYRCRTAYEGGTLAPWKSRPPNRSSPGSSLESAT